MRFISYAVIILAVTLLQASHLLELIGVTELSIKPDLLVILMVFFAVNCEPGEAILLCFATGFAADIISLPMGTYTVSFGIIGSALVYIRSYIMIRRMLRLAITIFIASIFISGLSQLLVHLKGKPLPPNAWSLFLGKSIYSAVLGPYVCLAFMSVAQWMGIVRRSRFGRVRAR